MKKCLAGMVLCLAGCGAVTTQSTVIVEEIMTACPTFHTRENTLEAIEALEIGRQLGFTFRERVDLLDDSSCGQSPLCRECALAAIEWVYFGVLP